MLQNPRKVRQDQLAPYAPRCAVDLFLAPLLRVKVFVWRCACGGSRLVALRQPAHKHPKPRGARRKRKGDTRGRSYNVSSYATLRSRFRLWTEAGVQTQSKDASWLRHLSARGAMAMAPQWGLSLTQTVQWETTSFPSDALHAARGRPRNRDPAHPTPIHRVALFLSDGNRA